MSPDPTTRARVLLLIPYLGTGGAQHVAATLARNLDQDRYEVHLALITQSAAQAKSHDRLPASVRVHALGARRARYAGFRLIALVWRLRPQLIFIGMAHLAPLLLLRFSLPRRTRIAVRQSGCLSSLVAATAPRAVSQQFLAVAFRRADIVICQTQSTAAELERELHLVRARLCVLPNPVDVERIRQTCSPTTENQEASPAFLLAIGRLVPEKGFDLLLEAFAAIKSDFPLLRLRIAGSGPCQMALQAQSRRLGVEDSIEFLGNVDFPAKYFANARAFVLSSREDEMPNALLEAAAAGLPIIATPASPGITGLLNDRAGVWLAQEASGAGLERALRDALTFISPYHRFSHEWIQPFALSPAIAAYEQAFNNVLRGVRR